MNNTIINNECAICYNYLFKNNTTFTFCCKQKIHKKCLDECYSINNRCPFCRTNGNQNIQNIILINPYYIDYLLLVIIFCLTITYLILRIIFSVIDIIILIFNEENLIIS
jgi:hypothetical protein